MSWREHLLIQCGPGVFAGITLGDWIRLLRENRFSVDLPYLPRAAAISFTAVVNSVFRQYEEFRYSAKWKDVTILRPLFVLGHWRSGTTHLHNLLGLDDRFACPQLYQVHYPHTFLSTERYFSGMTAFFLPKHRPYDNVRLALNVPDEDEFAMCVLGFMSPYLTGVFPRRAEYYDQFLTLANAPAKAIDEWKSSLRVFLQKVTLRTGKPLILKSPTHTGRIKLLLEMFPDARFVHIHRDPFTVFQSYVHTYATGLPFGRLQRSSIVDWTARIIRQYKEIYEAFFAQRALIPADRFHELSFEQLEQDPIGELRKLYAALGLPEFAAVEPAVQAYVESLVTYRKNVFPELAPETRRQVANEWRRCFAEWGYSH